MFYQRCIYRNWNSSDEHGVETCPIERDRLDMIEVCKRLNIPYYDVEFIKEYWNEVFEPFIETYKTGTMTPNPDTQCNKHIKFKYFKQYIQQRFQIDTIATGHYARIEEYDDNNRPILRRAIDSTKDQSYFLSLTSVSFHPIPSLQLTNLPRIILYIGRIAIKYTLSTRSIY